MKLVIRNLRFQPFTFVLAGGGSIHLRSREQKIITDKDVSAEIRQAAEKGLVDLMPQVEKPTKSAATETKGGKE